MKIEQVLKDYRRGRTTRHGLFLHLLRLRNREKLKTIYGRLPPDLRRELKSFALQYQPTVVIINGPRPDVETVEFVRGLQPLE